VKISSPGNAGVASGPLRQYSLLIVGTSMCSAQGREERYLVEKLFREGQCAGTLRQRLRPERETLRFKKVVEEKGSKQQ